MKPDTTPRSDLEIARATIAAAITRNASGIAAAVKPPAPFAREADYYEDWRTYWADIVAPFGEINLDQVQRELSDYGRLLDAVPLVYMHATGGQVSKPLTDPSVVCSLIDEHAREIVEDALNAQNELEKFFLEGIRDRLKGPPPGLIKGTSPLQTAGIDATPDRLAV